MVYVGQADELHDVCVQPMCTGFYWMNAWRSFLDFSRHLAVLDYGHFRLEHNVSVGWAGVSRLRTSLLLLLRL